MKIRMLLLCSAVFFVTMCDQKNITGPTARDVLISKDFIDDNSYRVVCRGFPEAGLSGVQKVESSKRAARLNAYYFIKGEFTDAVAPDRDGKVEKMVVADDHAVIYYVITKKWLKKFLRPEPKTETDAKPDVRPETDTGGGESEETKNK